jgi:hypothetical protein
VRRIEAHDSGATHGSKARYTARRHRPGAPLKNRLTTLPPNLELAYAVSASGKPSQQ